MSMVVDRTLLELRNGGKGRDNYSVLVSIHITPILCHNFVCPWAHVVDSLPWSGLMNLLCTRGDLPGRAVQKAVVVLFHLCEVAPLPARRAKD